MAGLRVVLPPVALQDNAEYVRNLRSGQQQARPMGPHSYEQMLLGARPANARNEAADG
jgi:hypothetical protein